MTEIGSNFVSMGNLTYWPMDSDKFPDFDFFVTENIFFQISQLQKKILI